MKRRLVVTAVTLVLLVGGAFLISSHIRAAVSLTRGPYLQKGTPTSMVLRWRTDVATDSRVAYGTAPDSLTMTAGTSAQTTEHEVTITGLAPDTRYFYSIGSSTQTLAGGDAEHYFVTSPEPGTAKPVRIWTFGDAGYGNANQRGVRDAYYAFTAGRRTDLLLLLGDNAYELATDAEYQKGFFDIYPTLLRNTVVWSTFGNHEGFSSVSLAQAGPYYNIFNFPTAGEAGGAPSGTEAYYSFDYANIHFVCLNSHDVPRANFGEMINWLRRDLAQNRQKWTIAYFHHPTYSKGSHNSDFNRLPPDTPESAASIKEMRENALPVLEEFGVDLVLMGHSHSYERSFLLDGHYGTSDTLAESMKIDRGNGRIGGSGAYRKPSDVAADSHAGTVYAVVGTGGRPGGGALNHPAMVRSLPILGSMVIDVDGDRLDAHFIDSAGAVQDNFTIQKGTLYPAVPSRPEIRDDQYPDQQNGIDRDGNYRVAWSYPAAPIEQPCGYQVEEASSFGVAFSDDGEEMLVAGENSKWSSGAQWYSADHPSTRTRGYSAVYAAEQNNTSLTTKNEIAIPAGVGAFLSFDSYEDIEKNFDYGFVEVGVGGAFRTVATYSGNFIGRRTVDLSAFAGQSIKIRFRVTTDEFTLPPQLGWYIDNISVSYSNFAPIAVTGASTIGLDITGRSNGDYAYRVRGLFGDCSSGPRAGTESGVGNITVTLGPPTSAPNAEFSITPNPAEVGQQVSLDASASRDNDDEGAPPPAILEYFWSFGDGNTLRSSSPTATHTYAQAGLYRVILTVTDNEGETAQSEQFLEVVQPQPGQVSGSGSIQVAGERAHFGFTVSRSATLEVSGDLYFHDKANNYKIKSTSITAFTRSGNYAVFSGEAVANKDDSFTFTVEVVDNGESGRNDTFRIRLSNGYEAGGTLTQGNIRFRN